MDINRKPVVLVSACLLGENCKYNGGNNYSHKLCEYLKDKTVVPFCPEVYGGLPIPRTPAEIVNGVVLDRNGVNVDKAFRDGAQAGLKLAIERGVTLAILQPRSPSCGVKRVYDGTFSGVTVEGRGVFATTLKEYGIVTVEPEDVI